MCQNQTWQASSVLECLHVQKKGTCSAHIYKNPIEALRGSAERDMGTTSHAHKSMNPQCPLTEGHPLMRSGRSPDASSSVIMVRHSDISSSYQQTLISLRGISLLKRMVRFWKEFLMALDQNSCPFSLSMFNLNYFP